MNVIVRTLKLAGEARPEHQVLSDPGVPGVLTGSFVGPRFHLKLHAAGDDSQMRPVLPELVDARVVSLHNGKMLWRGLAQDRLDLPATAARHEQEWAIKVIGVGDVAPTDRR